MSDYPRNKIREIAQSFEKISHLETGITYRAGRFIFKLSHEAVVFSEENNPNTTEVARNVGFLKLHMPEKEIVCVEMNTPILHVQCPCWRKCPYIQFTYVKRTGDGVFDRGEVRMLCEKFPDQKYMVAESHGKSKKFSSLIPCERDEEETKAGIPGTYEEVMDLLEKTGPRAVNIVGLIISLLEESGIDGFMEAVRSGKISKCR